MNLLNPSDLEFATMLAALTPADPTPLQRDFANRLITAFTQKSLALNTLSAEYVKVKSKLGDLQVAVGQALAVSMKPPVQMSAPTSSNVDPRTLVPGRLCVVRPEGA